MKEIIKFTSFLLCVMLTLSSLACASGLGYISPESAEGIINELSYDAKLDSKVGTVSRAQFVAVLIEATDMKFAASGTHEFSDVPSDSEFYTQIKTAAELGWISKSDAFLPDDAITLSQALKICVTALGGSELAEENGGYPFGYFTIAKSVDLLDDITVTDTNGKITGEDAAILIFRTITSEIFETYISDDSFYAEKSLRTILGTTRDMYIIEGICTANTLTDINDELKENDGIITIDGTQYVSATDDDNFVGFNVLALCKEKSGTDSIVAMVKADNKEISLTSASIDSVNQNEITYTLDSKEKVLRLDSEFVFIRNGKVDALVSGIEGAFDKPASFYTFIDNNSDNKYDVVNCRSYKYTFVDYVNLYDGYIYDKFSSDGFIDISDSECRCKVYEYFEGELTESNIDSVTPGSVAAVASSNDGKFIEIVLCFDSVEGKIEGINQNDGKVWIDSKEYELSEYYRNNYISEIGTEGVFLLGINGDVVGYELSSGSLKYAWLINAGNLGAGLSNDYAVKLFTQDDEVITLSLEEDVNFDGKKEKAEKIIADFKSYSDNQRLIRFGLSSEGKINTIDTAENRLEDITAYGEVRPVDNMLTLCVEGTSFLGRPRDTMSGADGSVKFQFSASKYLFVIPEVQNRNDDELYRLAPVSEIPESLDSARHDLCAYNIDLAGCPEAIVFTGGYLVGKGADDSNFAVVEKITRGNDPDGMECNYLYTKCNGVYEIFYLTDAKAAEYEIPTPGDIISLSFDGKKMVQSLTVWFDFETYTMKSDFADKFRGGELISGFAYSYYNNYMYLMGSDTTNPAMPKCPETVNYADVRNINIVGAPITYINAVRSADGMQIKDVKVEAAPISSVVTYRNGDESKVSFIVARLEWSANYDTFVYNVTYR